MRAEVLVVGGGPAGAMAARRLAMHKRDVLLVEKEPQRVKPCGGGIPSTAFHDLEIPLRFNHLTVDRIRLISPSERVLEIGLEGGSIVLVDRGEFDPYLRGLAEAEGAGMLVGELKGIDHGRRRITALIDTSQGEIRVEADYLIAADGVNSRVRSLLSLPPQQSVYTVSGKFHRQDTDACEFWFSSRHAPGGYSWAFPSVNGLSLGTGTLEPKNARTYFRRFLARRFKDETTVGDVGHLRGYRIPSWKGDLFCKGRIFFVGDAAGHVMPFTYEGIYYSMKSGDLAAQAILEGRASLFRRLWRGRFYSRFRLMKALQEFFLKSDERIEQLFNIFQRRDVQEASMQLWLRKDSSKSSIIRYINFFRKFLH